MAIIVLIALKVSTGILKLILAVVKQDIIGMEYHALLVLEDKFGTLHLIVVFVLQEHNGTEVFV
jgi:hypothetical protein